MAIPADKASHQMAWSDQDIQALADRITALEAGGQGEQIAKGIWKRIEPYITPILVAASAAAVLWINNLNHTTTTAAIDAVKAQSQANAEKVAEVKVAADKAADTTRETANVVAATHEEVKVGIADVKAEVKKPRPIFPGKDQ